MNEEDIKNKFVDYLDMTFRKIFYRNIMKKLGYTIDNQFYEENDKLFSSMVQEFTVYTKETFSETYDTMKIFLDKIFDENCSKETMSEITTALKKHINLEQFIQLSLFPLPPMRVLPNASYTNLHWDYV